MFGIFKKKKKPQNVLDSLIIALYGNPPPAKRANVGQAVKLANELLQDIIDEQQVSRQAIALNDGPIPYSTHDLAMSIALNFFQRPEYVPNLFTAQLFARLKVVEWHEEGLVVPALTKSFEEVLYKLYKPGNELSENETTPVTS